ncbi:delta(14)-sterol reductase TM7SF2-like isoform X2 [Phymastichus coffea]|uniref:delta(14)-sterol reductase TM7SF2-like isoform X2 n=1 Tax=Phymastichus coffea TaxID=108790 RepID=UPI00273C9B00|nr:delta(14)-sterol reductase TM7SF2-like isoform X2 [Phymastichus coffea]
MTRSQTRSGSRPGAGKNPPRSSSKTGSPDACDKILPAHRSRQVRVTLTRLEMPKVDGSASKTYKADEIKHLSNGSTIQLNQRTLKSRRAIRTTSNLFKVEQENRMPLLRSGDKTASQSDDGDLPGKRENVKKTDLNRSERREWTASVGVSLLTLMTTICIPLLQVACTNDHCGSDNFRLPSLHEWQLHFDRDAFLFYAGYLCCLTIVSVLPIGKVVAVKRTTNSTHRRINGLWTLILAVSIFAGLVYQGYSVEEFLIKNSLKLTITGLVYALVLSLVLYIKANWASASNINPYRSTNSIICNFWQGREINPRIGPVDVKQVLFKSTAITTNLINLAVAVTILKEVDSLQWDNLNNLNITALTVISLQTIFFADKLIFEERFLSSFEMSVEGLGYMLTTAYLIYPYVSTLSTRYLLIHKVQLPLYLIVVWTIVFFVGYWIYRGSNNQKDEFRKNPLSPALSHLETIPTPAGKRLLASGFWGYVRRPNYLGNILMHLAWAFLGFTLDIIPYVFAISTIVILIHRAVKDEARCEKRYRFAWKQYCQRVKYIILRPVF